MTENSMFFSNGAWYTQVQFARFLKDIFSDGVCDGIDNELEVIANTPANMAVQVKTGRSYVQGYIHEILTDPVQLAIDAADPTNPRIDRIVLHLDVNSARSVIVKVLKGTASASPVAPTLTQTSSIWQISLAQVRVNANATVINSGNITDERTFMTYTRDNQPKASTTEYGAVKVGSGLAASDGVISISYSAYPSLARLYATDTTYGTLIRSNTYNGTVGQLPMGLVLQNPTDTHTVSFSASALMRAGGVDGDVIKGHIRVSARNTSDGSSRVVLDTAVQTEYSSLSVIHTWSGSVTINLNEIIQGSAVVDENTMSRGSMQLTSFSSGDNTVWLGTPV